VRIVLLLLIVVSVRAHAQEPGSRLRVQTLDGRFTGTLAARSADTLFLQGTAARHAIPIRGVITAEESLGRRTLSALVVRRGAEATVPIAAAWTAMGLLLGEKITAGYVLFGAGLGAATGAFLGLTEPRRERWRTIELASSPP
jgi:hypothetical protein